MNKIITAIIAATIMTAAVAPSYAWDLSKSNFTWATKR